MNKKINVQINKKVNKRINKRGNNGITNKLKIFMLFSFLICTSVFIITFSTNIKADDSVSRNYDLEKHFGYVVVEYGDSLMDYAEMYAYDQPYEDYINEIIQINHLSSTELLSGTKLVIPFYR